MNGYQIAARVLRRAVQRQVAADSHVDAFHAAVGGGRRSLFGVRYDADGALAAHQLDFGLMIQFFPILVRGVVAFFHQCAVNGDSTVLVAGSAADAGTGNAVVILLADDGRLEAAYELDVQLQRIALAVIFFDRSAAVCVDDQLEGQSLIAIGSDGDHIAAFQRSRAAIAIPCKQQLTVGNFVLTAVCKKRSCIPRFTIHGNGGNLFRIPVFPKGYLPIISIGTLGKADFAQINCFLFRGGGGFRFAAGAAGICNDSGCVVTAAFFHFHRQIFVPGCRKFNRCGVSCTALHNNLECSIAAIGTIRSTHTPVSCISKRVHAAAALIGIVIYSNRCYSIQPISIFKLKTQNCIINFPRGKAFHLCRRFFLPCRHGRGNCQ